MPLRFKTLRFRGLKERGHCDLGNCVPKRSVSSCDCDLELRFGATTGRGQSCDLGNCIAKTLRFCVWKATKMGSDAYVLMVSVNPTALCLEAHDMAALKCRALFKR